MKKVLTNEELATVSGGAFRGVTSFAVCFASTGTTSKVPENFTFTLSTRK